MRDLGGVVRYKKRIDIAVCLEDGVKVVRKVLGACMIE